MTATEIIQKYTNGEQTLVETNVALAEIGAGFYLDINKHLLTEDEVKNGTAGLLDTGTGTMDKVHIANGELVNCDCGDMYALVIVSGKTYEVKGKKLIER